MSRGQETDSDIKITKKTSVIDPIRKCLTTLKGKGEYLVKQVPSDITNEFFIELEGLLNSLYTDLENELKATKPKFRIKSIKALMKVIDDELLPVVSEWSAYAKKLPDEPRPRGIYKNIKSIGGKIRDLNKKI